MRQQIFTWASWVAAAGMVLSAAMAAWIAISGVLLLSGVSALPQARDFGPFHFQTSVGIPVQGYQQVCQRADISHPNDDGCLRVFLHRDKNAGATEMRTQDAGIRPTEVMLRGEATVAVEPGWNGYLATRYAIAVLNAALVAVILGLIWRLLRSAGRGNPFDAASSSRLRRIGILVVFAALVGPILTQLSRLDVYGYWWEVFGPGMDLLPYDDWGISWSTVAMGVLVLLTAEVFRHGQDLQIEQELTV